MQLRRLLAIALGLSLALTACGGEEPTEPLADESPADEQAIGSKPEVTIPEGQAPPTTLETEDLVVGDGDVAEPGDTLVMHYVGKAWSTGEQFDASWDRGQPFSFTLGAGSVIAGWDQGIAGMAVGGRRRLVIPPDMGYGERGAPPAIGPNETLVFVVDLVEIVEG